METPNCQTTMPKVLPNQPIFCPWTSKAPLASSLAVRHGPKAFDNQASNGNLQQPSINCQHVAAGCSNNYQTNVNGLINMAKPPTVLHYPSIQQSTSQFFNFLRLMQLFPDVHPATLHTVLILCKNDFFRAVDKLLYAKRCKQLYNSRRSSVQRCTSSSKFSRHQPYSCSRPTVTNNERYNSEQVLQNGNNHVKSESFVNEMAPLDASVKKMQTNQVNQNQVITGKEHESVLKAKLLEPRKMPRNRMNNKASPSTSSSNDLPSVASLQCKLPIRPLSPMSSLPEDLSKQSSTSQSSS